MKALALANRLARDLDEKSYALLTVDVRQEILDAINGGLQRLHAFAPVESKTTLASLVLDAPLTLSLGVTAGSTELTGYLFGSDQIYRTLRLDGDAIDNQVVGPSQLFHPYGGETGEVAATLYSDAVAIGEPYDEMVGDPLILETQSYLSHGRQDLWPNQKQTGRPAYYHIEANAKNQNSPSPSVLRLDRLPDRRYRLETRFILAPARVNFTDLLSAGMDIPLRTEHIEAYLLPVARGLLSQCSLWREAASKPPALEAAATAEARYAAMVPRTLATPRNQIFTQRGY